MLARPTSGRGRASGVRRLAERSALRSASVARRTAGTSPVRSSGAEDGACRADAAAARGLRGGDPGFFLSDPSPTPGGAIPSSMRAAWPYRALRPRPRDSDCTRGGSPRARIDIRVQPLRPDSVACTPSPRWSIIQRRHHRERDGRQARAEPAAPSVERGTARAAAGAEVHEHALGLPRFGRTLRALPTKPGRTLLGMEEGHRDLRISPEEFDEVAAELGRSLDAFKVPEREKAEVLGAFAAHKGEVTEGSVTGLGQGCAIATCRYDGVPLRVRRARRNVAGRAPGGGAASGRTWRRRRPPR
jgi:hypothetical protein